MNRIYLLKLFPKKRYVLQSYSHQCIQSQSPIFINYIGPPQGVIDIRKHSNLFPKANRVEDQENETFFGAFIADMSG